jgi:two-component response regulator (ARR-B family)
MCVDSSKSVVMHAVLKGACDYWIKPLIEDQIKFIWKYIAMKIFNETKKLGIDEKLEVELNKELEKDDSKLPLIGETRESEIDNNVTKESVEEDKNISPPKKPRVVWSQELHKKFLNALMELNIDSTILYQFFVFFSFLFTACENNFFFFLFVNFFQRLYQEKFLKR